MGIYACAVCGNPFGWWSGNMRDVHDCPGPPRRQWPGEPSKLDWSEVDNTDARTDAGGVAAVPESGPLRELGAYLASVLDEDQWATAEALLLKASAGVGAPVKESGNG